MKRIFSLLLLLATLVGCSGGPDAAAGTGGGTVTGPLSQPHAGGSVLVMLSEADDDLEVEDVRQDFQGVTIERLGTTSFFVLEVPAGTDLQALLHDLDDDLRIVDSEPNYLGEGPEGDPSVSTVFGDDLQASVATQPALTVIQAPAAHSVSRGTGVIVAVVDTGVDPSHPLLAANLLMGAGFDFIDQDADASEERNFLDDDGDGLVDDQFGHGTFIASLVLAVAPEALVLPVRVLNDEGIGTASTVAAGIIWAADAGASVINISVDLPDASDAVKEAINYALDRKAIIIAAAGNDGQSDIIFPARFSDVVAVSATDSAGIVPAFANHSSKVSVVAPGVDVIGAYPEAYSQRGTARWSGTSFSTPLVSGTAALVLAAFPGISRDDARARVLDTATPVDAQNPGLAGRLGKGLINAAAAVQ
jgi:subtilisin family serine protease